MKLHNKLYDLWMKQNKGGRPSSRKQAAFEYRNWMSVIEHDNLPHLFNNDMCDAVKGSDYEWVLYAEEMRAEGVMPIEFSTAAFRLMHSRLAGVYRINIDAVARVSSVKIRAFLNEYEFNLWLLRIH